MKAVIISIICKFIAFIAVLLFVWLLVYKTGNSEYLWLLFLLLTVELLPEYRVQNQDETNSAEKADDENGR